MRLSKGKHVVYSLTYHVVFVTKYRWKFLTEEMTSELRELAHRLLETDGGELIELNTDIDHIHLIVSLRPDQQPSKMVCIIIAQFSKYLKSKFRAEIAKVLRCPHIWSPSYFIATTGGVTLEVLKEYVKSQQTDEHHKKYLPRQ